MSEKYKISYNSPAELPSAIRLDVCTLCQLNCHSCYMRQYPERVARGCKLGYLKFNDFKKFVDENNFKRIEIANSGEIFLNPELEEIIKYAFEKGITLTAYTGVNFNTVSDEVLEALVKYRFNALAISLDGTSQETYEKYRCGGNYEKVIKNIEKLNYYKEKYNSDFPALTWRFILFGHNEHEILKAKLEAKRLKMKLNFFVNYDKDFSPLKDKEFVARETGIKSFDCVENVKKEKESAKNGWFFCKQLWDEPQINWNGELLGCCRVYGNSFGANVFENGLFDALNCENMVHAKKMLLEGASPKEGVPCSICGVYKKIKNDTSFIFE